MLARSGLYLAFLLVTLAAFSTTGPAQLKPSAGQSGTAKKRVNLYRHVLGSIELPDGFLGYITADFQDAWAGYLEWPASGFKVNWRAGTIVYVLEDRKKDIEWQDDDKVGNVLVKRAAIRGKEGKTLVTKIGELEFSSLIRNSEDEKAFKIVIDSYQREERKTCLSLPRRIRN